jgi:hypothetical protein
MPQGQVKPLTPPCPPLRHVRVRVHTRVTVTPARTHVLRYPSTRATVPYALCATGACVPVACIPVSCFLSHQCRDVAVLHACRSAAFSNP